MNKIKSLNHCQKAMLIIMIAMTLIFAVIYPVTISKVGFRYHDAILIPTYEDGNIVYSGRMKGKQACFVVSDHTIVFQYGDTTYGPYTAKTDPTAIPEGIDTSGDIIGIEVCEGNEILFRGSVIDMGDFYWLSSEDGTYDSMIDFSYTTSDGIERDANGKPIDRMKPSASAIYELLNEPKLTHKGDAIGWFGAVFICILNAIMILYADSLFRWSLAFRIRNADDAEPSDWEITGRYISWTVLVILALVLFIVGLR